MITGALNTIFVELVFFFLTLGDQIDKTVQQLSAKKKKRNQMTGAPPETASLVQQESIMILQNFT